MTSTAHSNPAIEVISTGSADLDRSIGGGIPYRTLMLIEGQSGAGKSTLAQQFVWGALTSGENATLYITEQTVQNFLRHMTSLGQDVRDYFLMRHLEIVPLFVPSGSIEPEALFREIADHMKSQKDCKVIVVDSLSTFVSEAASQQIYEFFARCKVRCDEGRVIIFTVHVDAFEQSVLTRVRAVCDAHLRVKVEKSGSHLLKTLEVAKIRGAELSTGNVSGFEIEPGLGIRIIPLSRARA